MSLTRKGLSDAVYRRSPTMSRQQATEIVDAVLDVLAEALIENGELRIRGFGAFTIRTKAARPGRNPRNGEACEISARRVLTFRPSGRLLEAVNGNNEEKQAEKETQEDDCTPA